MRGQGWGKAYIGVGKIVSVWILALCMAARDGLGRGMDGMGWVGRARRLEGGEEVSGVGPLHGDLRVIRAGRGAVRH